MSLDHSPSLQANGGWAMPGLNSYEDEDDEQRSHKRHADTNGRAVNASVTWASAKARSARVSGNPSYQSQNQGFFGRHMRHISNGLPLFSHGGQEDRYMVKDKPLRPRGSRYSPGSILRSIDLILSRSNQPLLMVLFLLISLFLWFQNDMIQAYRRSPSLGGGSKFVIILAANEEGGVMYWKGAREWAIERDSVKNKKQYAERWGYHLEIVDMSTKKKYAHEWRESWEKSDFLRNAMKKYPEAEWFWWLDLNTFIMEPSISLQSHIFNNLGKNTYRDINVYNPLKISHPPNGTSGDASSHHFANYLDKESLSPDGDGKPESIHFLTSQDCSGFSLGSFFIRRSTWTDRLLDIWWDPVFYEQRHMEWEHKEQDALEYLYTNQPWVREHMGFAPQRMFNAFPPDACGTDKGVPLGGCKGYFDTYSDSDQHECGVQGQHYQEKERDFAITFAGCEWGRDCWAEMYHYRQLSNRLNRNVFQKFRDFFTDSWDSYRGKPPQPTPLVDTPAPEEGGDK